MGFYVEKALIANPRPCVRLRSPHILRNIIGVGSYPLPAFKDDYRGCVRVPVVLCWVAL